MKTCSMLVLLVLTATSGLGAEVKTELKTVDYVDLNRYLGTWYEIAKYPVRFEKGLVGITATYSLRKDGKILVLNAGKKGSMTGKDSRAKGKAWVIDKKTNSKLKVQFFWPFSGNYWIIGLGAEYDYAIIGDPSRKYLWILYRKPKMDEALYSDLLKQIEAHGYDLSKIEKTVQE